MYAKLGERVSDEVATATAALRQEVDTLSQAAKNAMTRQGSFTRQSYHLAKRKIVVISLGEVVIPPL